MASLVSCTPIPDAVTRDLNLLKANGSFAGIGVIPASNWFQKSSFLSDL